MKLNIDHTVLERFLRYVKIDTQSDPTSSTYPSTEKQKNLSRLLVKELLEMGVSDASLDEYGYVIGTIPSNTEKDVPIICFCSHVDTSPDASGKDVKPIIHYNYQGEDIILPDDSSVVIKASEHPDLKELYGNDIVTASGLTLLGADNKAGVSEIMDAANYLMTHPEVKHGEIKILFTPDEEIGKGVDHLDLEKLGATFAYTIDGERRGTMENETFSADGAVLKIFGVPMHPGFAKGRMESAIKIASDIVHALPKNTHSPETTEGKEGFIHPTKITGQLEEAQVNFILRAFTVEELEQYAKDLDTICQAVLKNYPNASYQLDITEQYRNMKYVLDKHPEVVSNAMEALQRAGFEPELRSIRGGTDGSRLSYMGLPCPNIFTGGHAFHSPKEWVSVQDMEKAVETIVHLTMVWEENS